MTPHFSSICSLPYTRSCGLLTARVISTAFSLQRPASGVSGGSAASYSGDDSSVVVSMVGQHVYLVRSSLLRLQHVFFPFVCIVTGRMASYVSVVFRWALGLSLLFLFCVAVPFWAYTFNNNFRRKKKGFFYDSNN
ncbi:hypothetical protein YC2023_056217 [Brassica napus]